MQILWRNIINDASIYYCLEAWNKRTLAQNIKFHTEILLGFILQTKC